MGGAAVTDSLQFSSLEQFTKGSWVEVSSDEEGFKGAWYVATILDPNPKKKPQKLYVEYQTLLDEDGSKPLREFVNLKFLRPIPPPEPDKIHCFELYDVVDALYRDGWWTGVIIRVLDNSRFVVAFQSPPDLIEFGVSELRVHLKWVCGKWIQPEKKPMRTTGLMFNNGKKVEVSFEKEEYRDAWFLATVIEEVWNNSFLVEYQRRGTNGGSELVKQIVDFLHIRPSLPNLKDKNFVLLEKVDAYIDFGWWSGVITKELADSRYVVFFKPANMEMEVNRSQLRPHLEWKDGNWVSASQDVLTSSDYQGHVRNVSYNVDDTEMAASLGSSDTHEGNSEERPAGAIDLNLVMENQIEQSTPCNEKASNAMTSLEEMTKLPTPDNDVRHSQPSKNLKEACATDSLSPACQLNTTPMDTPSEDTYFGFTTTTKEDSRANSSEQPMVGDLPTIKADNYSRGKKARSKRHKPGELDNDTPDSLRGKAGRPPKSPMSSTQALAGDKKPGEIDNHTPDPSRRKVGRPPKLTMSGTHQPSAGDKKDDAAGYTKEKFVEKESVSKEIIVTLNLEQEGMKNTRAKESHRIPHEESLKVLEDQRQQLHDLAADKIKVGEQLAGGGEIISRRKRGRPRKFPAKSPEVSAAVNQQNGGVTAYDVVVKDYMENEIGSPTNSGIEATRAGGSVPVKEYMQPFGVDKKILNGSVVLKSNTLNVPSAKKEQPQHGKVVQTSDKQHEKHSSRRGRRRTISVNAESPIQDPQDISVGKTTEAYEKDSSAIEEMAIDQLPSNMSDDQPLSMWFEGMQSPKTADASSVNHGRNVEQCTEATRSPKDVFLRSPVLDDRGGIVPGEYQSLPFVKNTPLWKTIESMEVFQKMPQKPHFRPLESSKENSREGLAIGFMVNFASVAEKTSSLQFDDSRSIIEDNLETLLELENHGFDVKLLRDRLTGLLLMKDKQEELQDQSNENRSRIRDINEDKSKIDEKIADINKKLRMLQEERALALSTKEMKDSEIAYLESTVDRINNVISSVRIQFEALVAAPW